MLWWLLSKSTKADLYPPVPKHVFKGLSALPFHPPTGGPHEFDSTPESVALNEPLFGLLLLQLLLSFQSVHGVLEV